MTESESAPQEVETAVETSAEVSNGSPGQRLRAERLKLALSEETAAERLHITRHYLRAIEEDAYERLPGEVFARGYVRNYCLLVALPTEPTMTLCESILVSDRRERAARGTTKRALTRADRNQRWLGLSLALSVALFGVVWFFSS